MTADEINIARAMSDGRWRTITDAALKAGLPEPRAMASLEALANDGRMIRERVNQVTIYRQRCRE